MRVSIAILNIALAIVLIYSPVAAARQTASYGDWNTVQSVPTGDKLIIKLKDGQTVSGKLANATDTALSLTVKNNRTETFDRNDIAEVYLTKGKASKAKYALIGAGAGAAIGGGIGAAKNSPPIDDGEIYTMAGIPIGAGIGAVVGLLFGQSRQKRVLIYQAR